MSLLKKAGKLFLPMLLLLIFSSVALADKASVVIVAPDSVKKGAEVIIKIKVTHSGNNFVHYVDWAQISVNGKEIARWDYSWTNRPDSENFEREVKYVATAPFEVSAEADCNMHGSTGIAKKKIAVTE